MLENGNVFARTTVALHPEGVDRNLGAFAMQEAPMESPSTRRAWIEINRATQTS